MISWNKLASSFDLLLQKSPFSRCLARPKVDLLPAPAARPLVQAVPLLEWIRRKWAALPACLLVPLLVWILLRWELRLLVDRLRAWILHRAALPLLTLARLLT